MLQNTTSIMSERRTGLIGALLIALGPLSMSLYTPAMPELAKAFGSPEALIKLTLSVYFGGFAFSQLIAGPVSDAFGRRKATLIFMTIYMIGSVMAAMATSIEVLLSARIIQGIGAAVGQTVARAIIRDQFSGQAAARIMNMAGIILAIAPAMAPTIGGLLLASLGWRSIFYTMLLLSFVGLVTVMTFMRETTVPDPKKAYPWRLLKAYTSIVINPVFLSATFVVAGAVGVLYTMASVLPFVLIDEVGLTPAQFGLGMLMQSGLFLLGSITVRILMRRFDAERLVAPGLVIIAVGSIAALLSGLLFEPSYLSVMIPLGIYAFGIAFVMPHLMIAALMPFPHIAGSASALMGFMQMASGLVGGIVAATFVDPHLAIVVLTPIMGSISVASYLVYRWLEAGEQSAT